MGLAQVAGRTNGDGGPGGPADEGYRCAEAAGNGGMMNIKQRKEEILLVRRAILKAIPADVSFASIIIALAECIKIYTERSLQEGEAADD
jgi:hypothetical protein